MLGDFDRTTMQQVDPVCGMMVDPQTAPGQSEYKGQTYYFCSPGCKRDFDRDPEKYLGPEGESMQPRMDED
jgi:Cu+-exporting ATPase